MRLSLILGGLAAGNILVSFMLQWYVVTRLGIGVSTDALYAGMAVPQFIIAVVAGSLTHVLVPLLAVKDEKEFQEDAWGFFLGILGLTTVVALILGLGASVWVAWLVPGFSSEGKDLTASLVRIQLLGMVFTAALSVLWSVYHARRKFIWAELSPLAANLAAFLALIWAIPLFGIRGAAWVLALSAGLQMLFLLPGLGKYRSPKGGSAARNEAWRRIRPLLLGTCYYKTDPLVDRVLASMAPSGGLSLLYLGQQLYGSANTVLNKAVAAPMVPLLAMLKGKRDYAAFMKSMRKRLFWTAGIAGFGYLVLLLAGKPMLNLVIGYGGVTKENVHLLWQLMIALGGMFIGGCLGQISSSAFYAMGDTQTPTRYGIWTFTVHVPFKVFAFLYFGLIGLAVATTIFYIVNFLLQWRGLERATTEWRRPA